MPHISINTPIVQALPDLRKHLQGLTGILHPRLVALGLAGRAETHDTKRVLGDDDREALGRDGARGVLVERLLVKLGRIDKLLPALTHALAHLARKVVVQPRRGAVRVHVPLRELLERREDEAERGLVQARLEEEVRVVCPEVEVRRLRDERLLQDFVRFVRAVLDE
jgi:hypothetical protein